MRTNKKQAFTMVELLVVLVILGILFVVLMANVDFTTEEAKSTGAMNLLHSYQTAAKTVGLQYTGFTNDMTELVYQLNKKLDPELQVFLVGNEIHTNAEDPWGTTIKIEYSEPVDSKGQIKFASAGADTVFDTGDDIITLLRCNMENEIVIENPVNDPNHTHEYTQEVPNTEFLYSEANCQSVAKYYRSCTCGARGDTTFEYGSKNFDKHAATIDAFIPYDEETHKFTRTCSVCTSVIQQSYELHQVEDGVQCVLCGDLTHRHEYTRELQLSEYKKNDATCSVPLTYYKSCSCGQKGTETFTVGTVRAHDFSKRSLDYFVSGATCASPAKYYLTCTYCNAKGTETYAYGNRDESNHVGGETIQYVNIDDTKHTKKIICMGCGYPKSETTENHFEGCGCHTHQYTEEVVMTDYLKTAATCTGKAVYYTSCNCGRSSQDTADENTFETGAVLGHAPASTPTWNADHSIATVKCTRSGCTQKWSGSSTKNVSVSPTCTKEEKFSHDVTINVNGTNKSFNCNTIHTGNKALSNHTGTLIYPEGGGSANVHQIYSCCKATANANHSYGAATCTTKPKCACGYESGSTLGHSPATTATWDTNHTKATVKCTRSGCSTTWSSTSVSETTTTTATCMQVRVYKHTTTFSVNGTNKTFECSGGHTGSKNASNHSGAGCTVVNAATASVCQKYSKCGASYDTTHNMAAATCTAQSTCTTCGYKTGSALGHSPATTCTWDTNHTKATVKCTRSGCSTTWSSTSVNEVATTTATCTVKRVYKHKTTFSVNGTNKTFECSGGHVGTVNASNHTGSKVYPSSGGTVSIHEIWNCCNATANANHSYSGASCTAPATCACGYSTGSALGHSWAYTCSTTCSRDSSHTRTASHLAADDDNNCTTAIKCKYGCGKTMTAAKSHTYSNSCDTTCNNTGCTAGNRTITHTYSNACDASCNVCGATRTPASHVSAYGGTSDVHTKCNVCGTTLSTSHSYTVDSGVQYSAVFCTAPRYNFKACVCGYNPQSPDYIIAVGSAAGHTPVNGGTADVHSKCGVCGITLSGTGYHVMNNVGTADVHSKCSCGYKITTHSYSTTESGGVKTYTCGCGHSYTEVICTSHYDSNPSYSWNSSHTACSASGSCDTCGTSISETGDVRHNNYREATCMYGRQSDYMAFFNQFPDQVCSGWHNDDGNINPSNHDSYYCSLNGCTRTCGATEHSSTYGGTSGVHTKCSRCSTTLSSTHSYSTSTSGSGCTAITTKTCACGYSYTSTGSHNCTGMSASSTYQINAASCVAPASYYYYCTNCNTACDGSHGHSANSFTSGSKTGHNKSVSWSSNCSAVTVTCYSCGQSVSETASQRTISSATCTQARKYDYTATVVFDGESSTYYCPDTHGGGSINNHVGGEPATCTTAQKCTRCGATITSALGHDWDPWTDTDAATCSTPGIQRRACAACGKQESQSTGYGTLHEQSMKTITEPATCASNSITVKMYPCCGAIVSQTENYGTKLAHTWKAASGTCLGCGAVCEHNSARYTYTYSTEDVHTTRVYCQTCNHLKEIKDQGHAWMKDTPCVCGYYP